MNGIFLNIFKPFSVRPEPVEGLRESFVLERTLKRESSLRSVRSHDRFRREELRLRGKVSFVIVIPADVGTTESRSQSKPN